MAGNQRRKGKARRDNERADVWEPAKGRRRSRWHRWSFWGAAALIGAVAVLVVGTSILVLAEM